MSAKTVSLTIDGLPVTVPEGLTILEAARKVPDTIHSGKCEADYVKILSYPTECKTGVMEK